MWSFIVFSRYVFTGKDFLNGLKGNETFWPNEIDQVNGSKI